MDHQWEPTPDFQVGQQVYISAEHIHTTWLSKKLSKEYLELFDIIAYPGTHCLHCVFPIISMLFIPFSMFPN